MKYQRTILSSTGQILGMLLFAACLMLIIGLGTILLE